MRRTSLMRQFGDVGRLNFCCDAHEGASYRVLGSGEHHLVFYLGCIGRPGWIKKGVRRAMKGLIPLQTAVDE